MDTNIVPKRRVVGSIEARMGSSRLPGKMLADIAGIPTLGRVIERLKRARTVDEIVVATSSASADDELAKVAEANGVACFRGSEDDVLGRVVGAHTMMGSEVIVEVTGDCPLVDPEVIDIGVNQYLIGHVDIVTNVVKPSYPMGIDVQVFPFAALAAIEASVQDPVIREHVSLYFYEHPELYRILHLEAPDRYQAPQLRLVLDYPEDLVLIREIYERMKPKYGDVFGTPEIVKLLNENPLLAEINRNCIEKTPR
jgi:spore coat polysaccharide biosynthesis protein SpsF